MACCACGAACAASAASCAACSAAICASCAATAAYTCMNTGRIVNSYNDSSSEEDDNIPSLAAEPQGEGFVRREWDKLKHHN